MLENLFIRVDFFVKEIDDKISSNHMTYPFKGNYDIEVAKRESYNRCGCSLSLSFDQFTIVKVSHYLATPQLVSWSNLDMSEFDASELTFRVNHFGYKVYYDFLTIFEDVVFDIETAYVLTPSGQCFKARSDESTLTTDEDWWAYQVNKLIDFDLKMQGQLSIFNESNEN
jgi:hypothetical protein